MSEKFGRLAQHRWAIHTTLLGPTLEPIKVGGYNSSQTDG